MTSAGRAPSPVRARKERRRNAMPRLAETSPTASKARSSDTISITSPGRAEASHTPAATAMRRSLQSRTPTEGALCTRWAPCRASSRAVSWPITRQLPTATKSVRRPPRSTARCSITRAMWAARLVFSTSKKIARWAEGNGRSGGAGDTRSAKTGSTWTVVRSAGSGASANVSTVASRGGGAASSGAFFRARGVDTLVARGGRFLVVFLGGTRILRYHVW